MAVHPLPFRGVDLLGGGSGHVVSQISEHGKLVARSRMVAITFAGVALCVDLGATWVSGRWASGASVRIARATETAGIGFLPVRAAVLPLVVTGVAPCGGYLDLLESLDHGCGLAGRGLC